MKFKNLLKSRKFWAALVGLVVVVLKVFMPDLPLDADQLFGIVSVLVAYILGVALEDGLRASASVGAPK